MPSDVLSEQMRERILSAYGAQLGELIWHSYTTDSELEAKSHEHFRAIVDVLSQVVPPPQGPLRFLEVGAYAHFTGNLLAAELGVEAVLCDISPNSLRHGARAARASGVTSTATLVAADFHQLPFESGYFDCVFVASAVHHTWRPEVMLAECLRVLRSGGVLFLYNEPCARSLCFYQFRSNREENFTAFERHLAQTGLLRTVSSPFYGSRPEQLFGMIENDRIPLDTYLDTITQAGEILRLTLTVKECGGPIEDDVVAMSKLPADQIPAAVQKRLDVALAGARPLLSDRDRLLGFSLPGEREVAALAEKLASDLSVLYKARGDERTAQLARLCGSPLRMVARRGGAIDRSDTLFRRTLYRDDGVWRDTLSLDGISLGVSRPLLPDIQTAAPGDLHHFSQEHWQRFVEVNGITMLNLSSNATVRCPEGIEQPVVLLVRFYAVCNDHVPYRVRVHADGVTIDEHVICQSESRLCRQLLDRCPSTVTFSLEGLDGVTLEEKSLYLRISVLQLVPLELPAGTS